MQPPPPDALQALTRRHFFSRCGLGIGGMALASLLSGKSQAAAVNPMTPRQTHHTPRAKNVIYLFMAGGPSQLDMFDYKPALNKYDGQPIPDEFIKGEIERNRSIAKAAGIEAK